MKSNTLYKTNKSGQIQQITIEAVESRVITTWGLLNGKQQKQEYICKSCNVGRANETTPEQQAQLEMDALIAKKLKSGYSYDSTAPVTVQLAMKVKSYQDQLHNVRFPCHASAKLDGVNAIYRRSEGALTIYSRGGEVYPAIPHLDSLVHELMDLLGSHELNGELYIHNQHLQDVQSAVKKPNNLSPLLSFCVFDIADSTLPFGTRASLMHNVWDTFDTTIKSTVSVIYNVLCHSHEDIELHYNECVDFGYEGTVIKNATALYQHNVRSSDMFKYKKTQSAEFLISGYNLDKNGLPVFVMKCTAGEFKAKPIGTKEFWAKVNPNDYLGNYATIEYETLSKDGIPLKPIFISLRSMDSAGNPKE